MKKILFIMLLLSPGIMYAMEDKQVHLQTFRDHINYAKAIGYSMLDQLCKSSITTTTREEGFANIVKAINQLQEDSDIADTLLMTKIRSEMRCLFSVSIFAHREDDKYSHIPKRVRDNAGPNRFVFEEQSAPKKPAN